MDKISITKLNGSNYQIWKFKVKLLLIKEDVWNVVKNELPAPANRDAAWCKRDGKAMAWIGLLLEDNQLSHVRNKETAKEAWDALKGHHEKSTLTNKIYILKRLCRIQLKEGGNMEDHINIILDLVNDLSALGETLKDNLVVALLLVSLPESYDSLVTALESRPEEDLTLEMVKNKLISDFKRKQESNTEVNDLSYKQNIAMISKKQVYEPKVCYGCGKTGHFIHQCRNIKKSESVAENCENYKKSEPEKSKKVSHIRFYESEDSEEDEGNQIAFMVSTKGNDKNWYIDSAATSNMANNINLFKKFNPNCREPVTLANGIKTTSQGIGEIETICFDEFGKPRKVIMKEVLFVPDLDSCLLSVRKLTMRGLKVVFEKDKCYIFHNGKIVATGSCYKNLYKLNCQCKYTIPIEGKNYLQSEIKDVCREIHSIQSSDVQISLFDNKDENIPHDNEKDVNENEKHLEDRTDEINEDNLDETIVNEYIEEMPPMREVGSKQHPDEEGSTAKIITPLKR